jgi:hypothetical protein
MPSSKAQQQAVEVVLMSLVGRAAFILRHFVWLHLKVQLTLIELCVQVINNSCRNFKGTTSNFVFCVIICKICSELRILDTISDTCCHCSHPSTQQ